MAARPPPPPNSCGSHHNHNLISGDISDRLLSPGVDPNHPSEATGQSFCPGGAGLLIVAYFGLMLEVYFGLVVAILE